MERNHRRLEKIETEVSESADSIDHLEVEVLDHRRQIEELEGAFSDLQQLMSRCASKELDRALAGLNSANSEMEKNTSELRKKRESVSQKNWELVQICQERYELSLRSMERISDLCKDRPSGEVEFLQETSNGIRQHSEHLGRMNDLLLDLSDRLGRTEI